METSYDKLPAVLAEKCPETDKWICNHANLFHTMNEYTKKVSDEGGSCLGVIDTNEILCFRCRNCSAVIPTPYMGIGWGDIDFPRPTVIVFNDKFPFAPWFKRIVSSHVCE